MDKKMHLIAGALIAAMTWFVLELAGFYYAPAVAIMSGIAAGFLKEAWDAKHGGIFDIADAGATLIGAVCFVPGARLAYLLVMSYGITWSHDQKMAALAASAIVLSAILHSLMRVGK